MRTKIFLRTVRSFGTRSKRALAGSRSTARNTAKEKTKLSKPVSIQFADRSRLSQVSNSLEMNILDDDLHGIHPPFMCKDYAQDIFWSEIVKAPISVYGLSWSPGRFDVSKRKWFNLGLRCSPHGKIKNLHPHGKPLQELLNLWEDTLDVPHSEVVEANDGMLLVRFHRTWTEQPIRVSMFLLMVRCGLDYKPGEKLETFIDRMVESGNQFSSLDRGYVNAAKAKLNRLIKEKKFYWKQTYEQYAPGNAYGIHGSSGIASYGGD